MKKLITISIITLLLFGCNPMKLTLNSYNNSTELMIVDAESYNKKGKLMASPSFKSSEKEKEESKPKETKFVVDAYKGGVVKLKYKQLSAPTYFYLDEYKIPNKKEDFDKSFSLSEVKNYNETNEREKLFSLGTSLDLKDTKKLKRLIDISPLLGTIIIGKLDEKDLTIIESFTISKEEIKYVEPNINKSSAFTTKKVLAEISLSIPIYGEVSSTFQNEEIHQVNWEIKSYPFELTSFGIQNILTLSDEKKRVLLEFLKAYSLDKENEIYFIRKFDIIESGTFSTTKSTKINTIAEAAIASVFTAKGVYTFKSEDLKFKTIQSSAYNLKFVKPISISNLIKVLKGTDSYQKSLVEELIPVTEIK
jgi:hypothetical protein